MSEVIVVTGAAGALGLALVRRFVADGARVAGLASVRSLAKLDGERCLAVGVDLGDAAQWRDALARIERELGPPTGAVLAAGAWRGGRALHEESDDETWRAMLTANLETAHRSLRALLPGMVARGKGSVVAIGSRAAIRPETSARAAAYAASKAALVALAQAVAAEVAPHGVRVNALLPATIDTAANRDAMPKADKAAWVSPESIAGVAAFLLSDAGRDVTGAALPVYGRGG